MEHNKPDNRIGRFRISELEIRNGWHDLLPFYGNFVIVDVRRHFDKGELEYFAYSPLFEAVGDWSEAPEYIITVAKMPEGLTVLKAERQ